VVDGNGVRTATPPNPTRQGKGFHAAQYLGAVVEQDTIHHTALQSAPIEFAACLDHEREVALAPQPIDDAAQIRASAWPVEPDDLYGSRFQQLTPVRRGGAGRDHKHIA